MCNRGLCHGEPVSVIPNTPSTVHVSFPSSCHLGLSIVYDTVTELSWSVDIRTHGIVNVIENMLNKTWAPSEAEGREVPAAKAEEDCVVSNVFSDAPGILIACMA